MVKQYTKELLVYYVNGTKDQFLDVEYILTSNDVGDEKEIILEDKSNRIISIQLNNVLKYLVKK